MACRIGSGDLEIDRLDCPPLPLSLLPPGGGGGTPPPRAGLECQASGDRPSGHPRSGHRRSASRGFTLLELIVVITIIGILATIAIPALKNVPRRAAEAALKTNLRTFDDLIAQHHGDKGSYPASLEALVESGYLKEIPADPITKSRETWVLVYEEGGEGTSEGDGGGEGGDGEQEGPGIVDVKSGSPLLSLDGTPYSEW
jgi:general secretion pathway protein G